MEEYKINKEYVDEIWQKAKEGQLTDERNVEKKINYKGNSGVGYFYYRRWLLTVNLVKPNEPVLITITDRGTKTYKDWEKLLK